MNPLLQAGSLGPQRTRNRIFFGPHVTNLGEERSFSSKHVAYYQRRAAGGAGVIVLEEASVHDSDWPYERCPLASQAQHGWTEIGQACHEQGALVLAGLGHAGGQGSSAYSQNVLLAPSRVPEVTTRELPKWMEPEDIAAVIEGFGNAAQLAMRAGLDGVEVNAGQHSLVRQFLSGLTNHREDPWGSDKLLFARQVLSRVKEAVAGSQMVVGLRLSCDEMAPWAGIVPETAASIASELAGMVDYIAVVRGSIFTVAETRPDCHTQPGFNADLTSLIRQAVPTRVAIVAQGSLVETQICEDLLTSSTADFVEMTRAQIADADLVEKLMRGQGEQVRPCILCNQTCQVRDVRNPIITCVLDPSSGHETEDAPQDRITSASSHLLVVGGGPAGMECARVAAGLGHKVTLVERSKRLGGAVRTAALGSGRERLSKIVDWLELQCHELEVEIITGHDASYGDVIDHKGHVVLCTGSSRGRPTYAIDEGSSVISAAELLQRTEEAGALPDSGTALVWDPIGGPIGISVAELLRSSGWEVSLATPDLVAGQELARSGDLASANIRLAASGVRLLKRSLLRTVAIGSATLEDRFSGTRFSLDASLVVDAGYRLAEDSLWRKTGQRFVRAGDCVAPRTIHEAVLEGRRAALGLDLDLDRNSIFRLGPDRSTTKAAFGPRSSLGSTTEIGQ